MGNASRYRPQPKTYKLRFEDDDYDGLVVRARSVKLGAFLEAAGLAGMDPQRLRPEDAEHLERLFAIFGDALVEWNLDDPDTGEPVPATYEGLRSLDADFVLPIVKAWFNAVAGVAGPLGPTSSAGAPSAAPPIPMEALSTSRAS